jgi:hypothetical protein
VRAGLQFLVCAAIAIPAIAEQPGLTVEDLVAVRYFMAQEPGNPDGALGLEADPIVVAPDGAHFFFTMRTGELSTDRIVGELQVFSTDTVVAALRNAGPRQESVRPARSVTFKSAHSTAYYTPISEAQWQGNDAIVFGGVQDGAGRGAYKLHVASGRLERLTPPEHDVVGGGRFKNTGTSTVYVAYEPTVADSRLRYPMAPVDGGDFLRSVRNAVAGPPRYRVYAIDSGGPARLLATLEGDASELGRWIPAEETQSPERRHLAQGLDVRLRQTANMPPVVIASKGKREIALTSPDPALEGRWLSPMKEVKWREPDGHVIAGGFMLPREGAKSGPLPLVVQAYRYTPHLFRPDGPYASAYAAQALVAQGMAVLAIRIPSSASDGPDTAHWTSAGETPREGQIFVENIDAAVGELARQGVVDANRVGLIGFSRGGYMAHFAVTHPGRVGLAAAIVADSYTGSYLEYLLNAAASPMPGNRLPSGFERAAEKENGGGTFWENKAGWLSNAPGFNADKARTPTLFSMSAAQGVLSAAEILGAWNINQRPYDFVFLPEASHPIQRPRERAALMQATVDWMRFWLKGEEDPTTPNDRRCIQPDVTASKEAPRSSQTSEAPWSWLDCSADGLASVRNEREQMYERWRTIKAAWQTRLKETTQ